MQVPDYGYRAYETEEKDSSLLQKAKDNPLFPIGQFTVILGTDFQTVGWIGLIFMIFVRNYMRHRSSHLLRYELQESWEY